MKTEIRVVEDGAELARAGADEFRGRALEAVAAGGAFRVVLSGGSTPRSLFSLLAGEPYRAQLPWDAIHFFWGDERPVPPDHPDSNYGMARETLLSRVPVPPANVHRIPGEEEDAGAAAAAYERTLKGFFRLTGEERPRFDLVYLGLGPDGHTASLFPGTKALHEERRLVVANWVGKLYTHRITLTAPVLNAAALVVFLVAGADKAVPLKAVLEGPREPDQLPAQLVRPEGGRLVWLVDRSAAARLGSGHS
ncbi:MAG TPA: 6-phosphogluconolactonase [Vicinamibacteria bacterium]|nr:6-phosphogluconolactonase [Vicinamibacteria bacterium]